VGKGRGRIPTKKGKESGATPNGGTAQSVVQAHGLRSLRMGTAIRKNIQLFTDDALIRSPLLSRFIEGTSGKVEEGGTGEGNVS